MTLYSLFSDRPKYSFKLKIGNPLLRVVTKQKIKLLRNTCSSSFIKLPKFHSTHQKEAKLFAHSPNPPKNLSSNVCSPPPSIVHILLSNLHQPISTYAYLIRSHLLCLAGIIFLFWSSRQKIWIYVKCSTWPFSWAEFSNSKKKLSIIILFSCCLLCVVMVRYIHILCCLVHRD